MKTEQIKIKDKVVAIVKSSENGTYAIFQTV